MLEFLQNVTTNGHECLLSLPGQMSRPDYHKVSQFIGKFGGYWDGKRKTHVFPYDHAQLNTFINQYSTTARFPDRNPGAYFPTTRIVLEELLPYCATYPGMRILEPSAGQGAIADGIVEQEAEALLTLIELDDINCSILRNKGYDPIQADFLTYTPLSTFNLIAMNPPFKGREFVKHVQHAIPMLAQFGRLIAVVPQAWEQTELHDIIYQNGFSIPLPDRAFVESGTAVRTSLIIYDNDPAGTAKRREPESGYPNIDTLIMARDMASNADLYQKTQATKAPEPLLRQAIEETLIRLRKLGERVWLTAEDKEYLIQDYKDDVPQIAQYFRYA